MEKLKAWVLLFFRFYGCLSSHVSSLLCFSNKQKTRHRLVHLPSFHFHCNCLWKYVESSLSCGGMGIFLCNILYILMYTLQLIKKKFNRSFTLKIRKLTRIASSLFIHWFRRSSMPSMINWRSKIYQFFIKSMHCRHERG